MKLDPCWLDNKPSLLRNRAALAQIRAWPGGGKWGAEVRRQHNRTGGSLVIAKKEVDDGGAGGVREEKGALMFNHEAAGASPAADWQREYGRGRDMRGTEQALGVNYAKTLIPGGQHYISPGFQIFLPV
ncbi:hypothetical protein KM043_018475 [Ampulex compressa]|nr:hypothetical protein KM043_018475 [Ampulex compressa]